MTSGALTILEDTLVRTAARAGNAEAEVESLRRELREAQALAREREQDGRDLYGLLLQLAPAAGWPEGGPVEDVVKRLGYRYAPRVRTEEISMTPAAAKEYWDWQRSKEATEADG